MAKREYPEAEEINRLGERYYELKTSKNAGQNGAQINTIFNTIYYKSVALYIKYKKISLIIDDIKQQIGSNKVSSKYEECYEEACNTAIFDAVNKFVERRIDNDTIPLSVYILKRLFWSLQNTLNKNITNNNHVSYSLDNIIDGDDGDMSYGDMIEDTVDNYEKYDNKQIFRSVEMKYLTLLLNLEQRLKDAKGTRADKSKIYNYRRFFTEKITHLVKEFEDIENYIRENIEQDIFKSLNIDFLNFYMSKDVNNKIINLKEYPLKNYNEIMRNQNIENDKVLSELKLPLLQEVHYQFLVEEGLQKPLKEGKSLGGIISEQRVSYNNFIDDFLVNNDVDNDSDIDEDDIEQYRSIFKFRDQKS